MRRTVAIAIKEVAERATARNFPEGHVFRQFDELEPSERDYLLNAATAAITAMREPTEAMLAAGARVEGINHSFSGFDREVYQAVIDAALSDASISCHSSEPLRGCDG